MTELRLLRDAVGLVLRRIAAEQHVFGENRRILSVWLEFEGSAAVHVFPASDGSLGVELAPPASGFEMAEAGAVEVVDVSSLPAYSEVVGRRLAGVAPETATNEPDPVGARLDFEGVRDALIVFNWGDELHAGSAYPPGFERGSLTD